MHICLFLHSPVQPCGNKANTLFSPYVLLKRALFDLKLIGQAWAQGLKAWTAGLSRVARVVVEVGEECLSPLPLSLFLSSFLSICPSLVFSQSLPTFIHALLLPFSTSLDLLTLGNWGVHSSMSGRLSMRTLMAARKKKIKASISFYLWEYVLSGLNNCPDFSWADLFICLQLVPLSLALRFNYCLFIFFSLKARPVKISVHNIRAVQQFEALDPAECSPTPLLRCYAHQNESAWVWSTCVKGENASVSIFRKGPVKEAYCVLLPHRENYAIVSQPPLPKSIVGQQEKATGNLAIGL